MEKTLKEKLEQLSLEPRKKIEEESNSICLGRRPTTSLKIQGWVERSETQDQRWVS